MILISPSIPLEQKATNRIFHSSFLLWFTYDKASSEDFGPAVEVELVGLKNQFKKSMDWHLQQINQKS
jgi:1,4-alpha-glucan branching enzyme